MAHLCFGVLALVACLPTPVVASRSLIEVVSENGGPLPYTTVTKSYNWSTTIPDGILRGSPDLPTSDPRLQPAHEGWPWQVSVIHHGPTSVRFGWATGELANSRA